MFRKGVFSAVRDRGVNVAMGVEPGVANPAGFDAKAVRHAPAAVVVGSQQVGMQRQRRELAEAFHREAWPQRQRRGCGRG